MSITPHQYGQYELHQCIESEAGYETWKAFATQIRRYVTIKIIHVNAHSATPAVIQRFQRDAQKLTSLQHPSIAQMRDFLVVQTPNAATTDFWIVTDYVEGISLAAYIHTVTQQGTVPPPAEVVRFLALAGSAIDYAHQNGVVHGNLNPSQILLSKYGTTSQMLGEPVLIGFDTYGLQPVLELPPDQAAYISPEVARAQNPVPQSDIYSLGVILYQICTGFLPFQGETSSELVQQHLHATPVAPATLNQYIPTTLTAVIMRSLAKDTTTRFRTATAMIVAVAQALNLELPEPISQSHSEVDLSNSPTFRSPYPLAGITPPPSSFMGNTGSTPQVKTASSPAHTLSAPGMQPQNTPIPPHVAYPMQPAGITPPPLNISGVWSAAGTQHTPPNAPMTMPQTLPSAFPSAPVARNPSRRRLFITIGSILALLLVLGGLLATFFLLNQQPQKPVGQNPIVGHAFFVSSGEISLSSNVGIADRLQIALQNLPPAPSGKNYYVWLLSDSKTRALPLALGQLSVQNGQAVMSYNGDSRHSDILVTYNRFLVTAEDANSTPVNYTLDKSSWIFGSTISETPDPADLASHYSLLDHIRHLLAQDPKLKAAGLVGGLDIWLFRNTQKILEWSGSARDASDPAFMQRQIVRILDYLDGSQFVGTEKMSADVGPILQVDPVIARVALLTNDPTQSPPAYLAHIGNHLREITHSPGVSPEQQALAVRITAAINNVEVWLQAVHVDAEKLIQMPRSQLLQPEALALLNDMFTQANNAFIGQTDPKTLKIKEGIAQIHYSIQRLATFDVTSCATNKIPCA